MVKNLNHYINKRNKNSKKRIQKLNEIVNIIGGEPTQYTQVIDMCVDYVLKTLQVNPNEMNNMNIYNMRKNNYDELQNTKAIIIQPTFEERQMLQYLKQKTFIKNYADLYSYTLSCISQMEQDMEGYDDK